MAPQPQLTLVPLTARVLPRAQVPPRPQQHPRHLRPGAKRLSISQLPLVTRANCSTSSGRAAKPGTRTFPDKPVIQRQPSATTTEAKLMPRDVGAINHLHLWTNENRRHKTLALVKQAQRRSKKGVSVPAAGRTATGAGGAPSTGGAPHDYVSGAGKGTPLPRPVRNTRITGSTITTVIGGGIAAT
jgi:hypothetical protein